MLSAADAEAIRACLVHIALASEKSRFAVAGLAIRGQERSPSNDQNRTIRIDTVR